MRAVVMAGGAGVRLRPLTLTTPKPLLPVADRPIVEHLLRLLRRHGIDEAVVTLHYLAATVRGHLGDGADLGMQLTYVTEPRPVGTAGSVKLGEELLREGAFLVVSGDGLTDIDLGALVDFHRNKGAMVTVALARRANPMGLGIVVTDDDGRVIRFLEKPDWGQVFTDTVNTGIYVVEPEVLDLMKPDEDLDWSSDVFPALLSAGADVYGYVTSAYWEDVGTLDAYRRVQRDALDGLVSVEIPGHEVAPGVWFGAGVEVDPGAQLQGPMVLGDHVRVGAGAVIAPYTTLGRHTIVGERAHLERTLTLDNVYVGPEARLRGCLVGRGAELMDRVRVEEGSTIGDQSRLEDEAVITGGADIFPHKTIEAGARVSESVVWDGGPARSLLAGGMLAGTMNIDITAESVARTAGAFASLLPKRGRVAVGRDHSPAAEAVALVLEGALAAAGLMVESLGVVPAPVIRNQIRHRCDGGVIVRTQPGQTDHLNLVLLDRSGHDLSRRSRQDLERIVDRHDIRRPAPNEVGKISVPPRILDDYVSWVLEATDTSGISEAGMRIVVDTSGGPCASVLPSLMAALEIDVLAVNSRLTPEQPTETPESRSASLTRLGLMVASSRATLGVRIDPTGERLSIVDETGRVLSDDRALLVVLDLIAAERGHGAVALPVTTTRIAEKVTSFHGVDVIWTATGPQALAAASTADGLVLAGDADGGFVIPSLAGTLDAMAALIQVLGLVARTQLSLRQIDTRIPHSVLLRRAVPTPWARKAAVMAAVRRAATGFDWDDTEGVRVVLGDQDWVLISPDPEDAAVRLWAEARDQQAAEALADRWAAVVSEAAAT